MMTPPGSVPGRWMLAALLLALLVAAAYALAGPTPVFQALEGQTLTWRFKLRGPLAPGPETVIVMIDDRSTAEFGGWPLPRGRLAQAVEALGAAGARIIALDLLLADRAEGAAAEPGDQALAKALAATGDVIVPFTFVFATGERSARNPPEQVARAAYRVVQQPAGPRPPLLLRASGLLVPTPAFAGAPTAHVTVLLEEDGTLRHAAPAIAYGEDFYPSLPVEAARRYLGLAQDEVTLRLGAGIALGDRFIPSDSQLRWPVNYFGPDRSFETHSFADLLGGKLAPEVFAGRIVLIGSSVLGTRDVFVTPFSQQLPGTEYFATVIDNILHDGFLKRGLPVAALDVLAILLGGLAAALLTAVLPPVLAALGAVALLAGWGLIAQLAFQWGNLWLNAVFPVLSIVLAFAGFSVLRALGEGHLRGRAERQRTNLARYLPGALAERLAEGEPGLSEGRVLQAAVLFVDMVGFTSLSEEMTPHESMALLRDFHGRVERAVQSHRGVIDKFLGDGVMASFGLPEPAAADPLNALRAARDLADEIARWGTERSASGLAPIAIGIGLHYGPVVAGDLGGETQRQFTLTGDTVNVASRIEALTRSQRATILASEALIGAAQAQGGSAATEEFVALPPQQLRGRASPMVLWAWPAPGA